MRKKHQKDADNYFESNAFLKNYVRNRGHNMKILLNLYHGNYYRLFISTIFFVIKNSPVWVVPIATANIVDAATSGGSDGLRVIIINMVVLGIMWPRISRQTMFMRYFTVRRFVMWRQI